MPFVTVDDGRDEFFGGLLWSGAWNISVERLDDRLHVTASFPGLSPTVGFDHPLELPHGFFGVTSRAATTVSGALRQFVLKGLRHGRPFQPLVTYNTWFAYGTTITEELMNDEIDRAAALGVELFVVDAGWYVGAGATSDSDFESGLGSWTTDTDRFPSGLAGLADRAHALGMKFGLWVEPERVSLDTVDLPTLAQESVARHRQRFVRIADDGARLSCGCRGAPVGVGRAGRAHRGRASRLHQVGQQLLAQLQSRGPRARADRRQFRARPGAVRIVCRRCTSAIPT